MFFFGKKTSKKTIPKKTAVKNKVVAKKTASLNKKKKVVLKKSNPKKSQTKKITALKKTNLKTSKKNTKVRQSPVASQKPKVKSQKLKTKSQKSPAKSRQPKVASFKSPAKRQAPKAYDPKSVENNIYKTWEEKGHFSVKTNQAKKPYTIAMPPPNVTSQLHLGHALTIAVEDILIRYKRMKGFDALWAPGADHAGIATQNIVNQAIEAEGSSRLKMGREKFIKKCWEHTEKYQARITSQIRAVGASCDWTRERFTLDDGLSEAVQHAFINLYKRFNLPR